MAKSLHRIRQNYVFPQDEVLRRKRNGILLHLLLIFDCDLYNEFDCNFDKMLVIYENELIFIPVKTSSLTFNLVIGQYYESNKYDETNCKVKFQLSVKSFPLKTTVTFSGRTRGFQTMDLAGFIS